MLPSALGGLRARVPPVPGRLAPRSMEKINVVQFPAGQLNCITFALLPSNSKILEQRSQLWGSACSLSSSPSFFCLTQRPCGDASNLLSPMRHVGLEAWHGTRDAASRRRPHAATFAPRGPLRSALPSPPATSPPGFALRRMRPLTPKSSRCGGVGFTHTETLTTRK